MKSRKYFQMIFKSGETFEKWKRLHEAASRVKSEPIKEKGHANKLDSSFEASTQYFHYTLS